MSENKKDRPIFEYDVPDECGGDVRSVGIVELTTGEELLATKRARGDAMRLAYELAKQSLVEVNGAKVNIADGSADEAWAKMTPKTRNLVLGAYGDLHAPSDGAAEAFRASRRVKVG